jgi:alkylated DNA repair protein (DNA oxidative demethylase)
MALFADPEVLELAPGALLLRAVALAAEQELVAALDEVLTEAPPRRMLTPGGLQMSVAMSNCGALGWVSDRAGYRYQATDPASGRPWPAMPGAFATLARQAAALAGFDGFEADACLLSIYEPGARLSLHQDKDELEAAAHPIVSISLGLPATFQLGGLARTDARISMPLAHGDGVVWGGPARLRYHGVAPLKDGQHPLLGRRRVNLSFRRAG